jgi:hypothetical protein
MTRAEIIKMARDAGLGEVTVGVWSEYLERFAALVAAHERQEIDKELGPLCRVGSVSQYVQGRWDFAEELQSILKERGKK